MLEEYLKAGFPAILLLTSEPARAEKVIPFEGQHWRFFAWDYRERPWQMSSCYQHTKRIL